MKNTDVTDTYREKVIFIDIDNNTYIVKICITKTESH